VTLKARTAAQNFPIRENKGMSSLRLDLRFALRTLRKNPGFTATALAALALGIGATTAIFSVVNTVLLRPLTFPDPDRIVSFFLTSPNGPSYGGSATRFNVWREQNRAFQDISAYEYNGANLNLTGGVFAEQIHGIRVSSGYFRLFGAPVIFGRTFTADEDRPNGGRAVVLNYGLWQRRFGGDPRIVGKTISLGGTPYLVVGIVGPGFNTELDSPPDVWLPFQIDPASVDHAQYFSVVARLRPGVTLAMAKAQLQLAANEFRRKFPNMMGQRDGFAIEPFPEAIVSEVRSSLLVLAGAVSFVLLIACANVANLLLVRATGRKREIALRAALGAGRGRIIRQLLTESVVLSALGGALGLGLGLVGVHALLAINPGDIPRIGEHGSAIVLDWRLVAFTSFVSLAAGIVFGLIPALDVSRTDLSVTLKEGGGRSGTGFRQNKTRSLLVVSEMALALVLLIGAALLIRSFVALRAVNPGFDARNILTMRMSLAEPRFEKTSSVNRLIQNAVQRIETLPAVLSAGASYTLPLEGGFGVPFNIVGRTPATGRYDGRGWIAVSPHYFDVFKIPFVRGRVFNDRDDAAGGRVAIINEALARQFWPKGDPIGERVLLGKGYGPEFEEPERQIVGIAQDVHDFGLNRNPSPMVYVPMAQVADGLTALVTRDARLTWIVRTRVDPRSLRSSIAKELEEVSGGLPVANVRSMKEVVSASTARADFNMTLLAIFGAAALLLAVIGVYGLMAYSVGQRTRELGIRLALGAESARVRNMVVGEGMRLALIGVVIGMAAAFGLTRLLRSFLFGVEAWDPMVFVTVPVVLSAAALMAVWFPARRAAGTDPAEALRQN
jgi:putative ABC transport system permease protein